MEETRIPATKKQTFAIYCISGHDVRPCKLSIKAASQLISNLNSDTGYRIDQLPLATLKNKKNWKRYYSEVLEVQRAS